MLIQKAPKPLASGSYDWENQYVDQIWTYSLEDIWRGLQGCYQRILKEDVWKQYQITLKRVGSLGISAMMHGYMAFDRDGRLLVPLRALEK